MFAFSDNVGGAAAFVVVAIVDYSPALRATVPCRSAAAPPTDSNGCCAAAYAHTHTHKHANKNAQTLTHSRDNSHSCSTQARHGFHSPKWSIGVLPGIDGYCEHMSNVRLWQQCDGLLHFCAAVACYFTSYHSSYRYIGYSPGSASGKRFRMGSRITIHVP